MKRVCRLWCRQSKQGLRDDNKKTSDYGSDDGRDDVPSYLATHGLIFLNRGVYLNTQDTAVDLVIYPFNFRSRLIAYINTESVKAPELFLKQEE